MLLGGAFFAAFLVCEANAATRFGGARFCQSMARFLVSGLAFIFLIISAHAAARSGDTTYSVRAGHDIGELSSNISVE